MSDTLGVKEALLWSGKRLYEGTGFPQGVQGKRGENQGESRHAVSMLFFYDLQCV
jgi:hypothetical protein